MTDDKWKQNIKKEVDFYHIGNLAYANPISFACFGDEQTNINSWKQLYVKVPPMSLRQLLAFLLKLGKLQNHNIMRQNQTTSTMYSKIKLQYSLRNIQKL